MKKRLLSLLTMTSLLISLLAACQVPIAKEDPKITAQEAEEIALEDAGLTRDQVKYLHSEYDFDDGIGYYEVQFTYEQLEYEYEIKASDGKIISFDKDRD